MIHRIYRGIVAALGLLILAAPVSAARLVSDTFSGQNGTRPTEWAVVGELDSSFWSISENRLISGDQARTGSADPLLIVSAKPGAENWADFFGQVDFTLMSESGSVVAVARYQNRDNFYEAGIFSEGGNRFAKIDRIRNGQRRTLARIENSPSTPVIPLVRLENGVPQSQILRIVVVGSEIALQAGVGTGASLTRLQAFDSEPIRSGTFGFGVFGGSAIFDNAIVDSDPSRVYVIGSAARPTPTPIIAATAQRPATGNTFVVQVGSNLPRERADSLADSLRNEGYADTVIVPVGGGFSVFVGTALARPQADTLFQRLRSQDFNPEAVVQSGAEQSGTALVTAASPAPGTVFRVQVFEDFSDAEPANRAREALIADDYANVQVEEANGRFRVLLGVFQTQADAQQMVDNLLGDNYPSARVVQIDRAQAASAAPANASELAREMENLRRLPELANLPAQEQQRVLDLFSRVQSAEAGNASAREVLELREQIRALSSDLRNIYQGISRTNEERMEREGRIRDVYRLIESALDAGNVEEATRQFTFAQTISRDFPGHAFMEARINEARAVLGGTAASANAPSVSGENAEQLMNLLAQGRQAKLARNLPEALNRFQEALAIDPNNREAAEEVRTLPALISAERAGDSPNLQTYLLYGGISALLVMFVVIGILLVQNIRRERELINQVSQMQEFVANQSSGRFPTVGSNPSLPPLQTGTLPGLSPDQFTALQSGLPASQPATLTGAPQSSSLSPSLTGMMGVESSSTTVPLPFPGPPPVSPRGPLSDEIRLSPIAGATAPQSASVSKPEMLELPELPTAPVASPAMETRDVLEIPGLSPLPPAPMPASNTPEPFPPLPQLPGSTPTSEPGSSPGTGGGLSDVHSAATVFLPAEPPQISGQVLLNPPSSAPGYPPPPLPAQPTPSGFDSAIRGITPTPAPSVAPNPDSSALGINADPSQGIVFHQTFDDENVGEQPRGWQGDYDYASLTVDSAVQAYDVGNSLKFEKLTGAGSANYVCRFPKAYGSVRIEFDIRCDDKNKYLLGFYIEKDEDFKQSIHTIIHRMDSRSTPSLRIQGEPVAYEFGTWKRMTYDLDLMAATVTAYVDGELVIENAKLPTAPAYVNTLSIRDNLATTGILYLDNIKISKR